MKNLLRELDSNITLDLEQIAIIEENEKNLLVVAGAGSGKIPRCFAFRYFISVIYE